MLDQPKARAWSSVRLRATAGAVLVVAAALVVASVVLVLVMRETLTDGVRDAASLRATEVAAALDAGAPADDLRLPSDDDTLVQVLGADGDVVAASPEVDGAVPLADVEPGSSRQVDVADDDDPFLVVARSTSDGGTVLVARTLDSVVEPTSSVVRSLLLGVPLLLVVVGVTVWLVVGRALAPVDAMRAEVDGISMAALDRRLARPGSGDEIDRLAVTMNRMLDRLEASQVRQRRFVSDASHELRSPLAAIRQHAEVALAHPDRVELSDLASTVLAEDLRMQHVVEDLLLLARLDEQVLGSRTEEVDLDDLLGDEARRLRAEGRVAVDATGIAAGRVVGEPRALRRVVRNLTDNASRHARSTVWLSLGQDGDGVRLVVEDDGPGIPAAERQRVLERFTRLDEARARDAGGSGLGLAIVSEVVAMHGGSVTIEDGSAGGARVVVTLPNGSGSVQAGVRTGVRA